MKNLRTRTSDKEKAMEHITNVAKTILLVGPTLMSAFALPPFAVWALVSPHTFHNLPIGFNLIVCAGLVLATAATKQIFAIYQGNKPLLISKGIVPILVCIALSCLRFQTFGLPGFETLILGLICGEVIYVALTMGFFIAAASAVKIGSY